jgi:predicted glycoside hydrolase/deacetylase ChbG (UPF0249 family)
MSRARLLVVNADGYGFTPGVNEGIVRTFESGIVRSTSCTPNFGHLGDAGAVQARFPQISFGIHFNLNVGPPCAPPDRVRSLVGPDGYFLGSKLVPAMLRGQVKMGEVELELTSQAAMLLDQGIRISHWDGHQNKHLWPVYFEAASRVARKCGIPGVRSHRRQLFSEQGPTPKGELLKYYVRNPHRVLTHLGGRFRTAQAARRGFAAADRLITPGYADGSHKSLARFWYILADTLEAGLSEVYCHPGFPDELLRRNSQYVEPRAAEVAALTDPMLKQHFETRGVRLISFWDLALARNVHK